MAVPFLTLIAKEALFQLFNKVVLVNAVSRDYENYVASKGETVTIVAPEVPATQAAGGTFSGVAINPSTVNLKLDQWIETVPLKIDAKTASMSEIDLSVTYAEPVASALAKAVEQSVADVVLTFTGHVGTADTPPTGIGPIGAEIKAKFDSALTIPDSGRIVVLSPEAEVEFHKTFGPFQIGGDQSAMVNGLLGTKFGMQYIGSPLVTRAKDTGVTAVTGAAFHKSAIALASRPMAVSKVALPGTQVTVNYKGVGLTMELWHDPFTSADYLRGQMLYGVKKVLDSRGFTIAK